MRSGIREELHRSWAEQITQRNWKWVVRCVCGKEKIWALGSMVEKALDAAELLKEQGIEAGVVNQRFVKPLDEEALQEAAKAHDLMVTLEDNVLTGGAGEEIDALLINENTRVLNMGWPDTFIEHGSCDQLYRVHGLDAAAIAERIKKELEG